MDAQFLAWLKQLIAEDNLLPFYKCKEWRRVRAEVLRLDKNECQRCKDKGKYERGNTAHHVNEVKHRPELALSIWYVEDGKQKRNIITVSHQCHEEEHNHRQASKEPLTIERW